MCTTNSGILVDRYALTQWGNGTTGGPEEIFVRRPNHPLSIDIYFKTLISIVFTDSSGAPYRSGTLNEKQSLITAMKILQYEYEQNNDQRDNDKWETVGVRMQDKNKQLSISCRKETMETNKKFEILSDSEDDESHALVVERMPENTKPQNRQQIPQDTNQRDTTNHKQKDGKYDQDKISTTVIIGDSLIKQRS